MVDTESWQILNVCTVSQTRAHHLSVPQTSANADGTGATFWVSEEYGPSVSKVGSDGTVLARHVPAGVVYDTFVARANPILAADSTNG